MPLTYQVLRCYKCSVFQVHQTKRTRTWACKMCDEKQSLKRFYSLGTAKECRLHVQTLNEIRGEMEHAKGTRNSGLSDVSNSPNNPGDILHSLYTPKKSKWEDFLDENDKDNRQTTDENKSLDTEVVSEQAKKRVKKAPKIKCSTKIPTKNNRLSPEKLENNFRKGNPIPYNQSMTVIYKAKPNSQEVSGSRQSEPVKNPGIPLGDSNSSWMKFVDEYDLNDLVVKNEERLKREPREWFSTINDTDLDTILEF